MKIDISKIDNIEFDGINGNDWPECSDVYISSADYDGQPMTEEQLHELIDQHPNFTGEQFHGGGYVSYLSE